MGPSTGAAFKVASDVARRPEARGKSIVVPHPNPYTTGVLASQKNIPRIPMNRPLANFHPSCCQVCLRATQDTFRDSGVTPGQVVFPSAGIRYIAHPMWDAERGEAAFALPDSACMQALPLVRFISPLPPPTPPASSSPTPALPSASTLFPFLHGSHLAVSDTGTLASKGGPS